MWFSIVLCHTWLCYTHLWSGSAGVCQHWSQRLLLPTSYSHGCKKVGRWLYLQTLVLSMAI
jgi:hypothetical protein